MFFIAKYKRNAERLKMIFSNALHGVQEGSGFEWKAFVTHVPTELRAVRLSQELLRLWLVISNTVRDVRTYFFHKQKTQVVCKNVAEVVQPWYHNARHSDNVEFIMSLSGLSWMSLS